MLARAVDAPPVPKVHDLIDLIDNIGITAAPRCGVCLGIEVLREMSLLDEFEWVGHIADPSRNDARHLTPQPTEYCVVKYLSEYGDASIALPLIERIKRIATQSWTLMEVCGGQTHTIVSQGLHELLDGMIEMIHGPDCPVCITPLEQIDKALTLAARPDVIFTSVGDMLRVPGSSCDLQQFRARGGTVRVVYSPLDALALASRHPDREIVFFAVGFETTAPANAMAVWRARELGITNFSVLVSHVSVPPAIAAIMAAPNSRVRGFLAAGHVCTVMGWSQYVPLATRYRVPIVVTGFEPVDILEGILMSVRQLESGRHEVENQYVRSVRPNGTPAARERVANVFELVDRKWRGIGEIPMSGFRLRAAFAAFDAERKFALDDAPVHEPAGYHAGEAFTGTFS